MRRHALPGTPRSTEGPGLVKEITSIDCFELKSSGLCQKVYFTFSTR